MCEGEGPFFFIEVHILYYGVCESVCVCVCVSV